VVLAILAMCMQGPAVDGKDLKHTLGLGKGTSEKEKEKVEEDDELAESITEGGAAGIGGAFTEDKDMDRGGEEEEAQEEAGAPFQWLPTTLG
jgi:hypothetical protein